MKIYDGTTWRPGFLDPHRPDGSLRIRPTRWLVLGALDEVHIVPERSLRRVFDYARELGPVRLARKVTSRLRERPRNRRVCACGIGEVVEGAHDEVGGWVVFFAPDSPPGSERVVVDRRFTRPTDPLRGELHLLERASEGVEFWREWAGWHPMSGEPARNTGPLLERCESIVRGAVTKELVAFAPSEIQTVRARPSVEAERRVTLFGWGHHARTQIVPALPDAWALDRVHELEPTLEPSIEATWDTSPDLRPDEPVDVVCVAGFHHTHAGIATETLRRGGTAVVEKPVVTSFEQLEELSAAWREPSRLHALYHKRYGRIAEHLRDDLTGPVDMHATVYEIPLPRHHWYGWPSSGGRIVSNGCHWIDQFHWLNGAAERREATVTTGPRGQLSATLSLDNGAFFTLTLTDRGSARRGTREVVEFRTDGRTARVIDGSSYTCEDGHRVIRSTEVHPLDALESAYAAIFERIANDEPGDSLASVRRTHESMLELERLARLEEAR